MSTKESTKTNQQESVEMATESKEIKPIETQVAEWSATDATLREAVEATKGITVAGFIDEKGHPNPKKGRDAVHSKMMTLANHRTAIEARRVELKRPVLDLGKLVDSEAARLTAIVKGREDEMRADRDAYDAEQKRIAEAIEAERKRKEEEERTEKARALQVRVDAVSALGGSPNLGVLAMLSDEDFSAMISALEAQKAEREEAERIASEERAKAEREEAERRRLEIERQEKEAEQRRAAEAAEAAERRRIQAEEDARRAEEERKIAAERAQIEAERKALEEQRRAAEAAEWARQERARIEEEERQERAAEAERKAKKEAQDKADAERADAEKPDRTRAADWARNLARDVRETPKLEIQEIQSDVEAISEDVAEMLERFATRIESA